jgi:hypothetical protein
MVMGRDRLSNDLTTDNIEEAKLHESVDVEDTLRRVALAWLALGNTCDCGSNAACDICEIDYLLEEAFEPIERVA